jgi:SAM-dependent methyltransferase
MASAFASPSLQERLLLDCVRCEAYRDALQRTVRPGDVVLDLGAGTGLLSFFALQAGARHVYALEMSGIAEVAAELIEANGLHDRITLIRENSAKVRLPERCDLLITETLSVFGFDSENTIASIADARKRLLKAGARILPEACSSFLMPFSSDECGPGRFPERLYDIDYRPFRKKRFAAPFLVEASGKRFSELSQPSEYSRVDFKKDTENPRSGFVAFRVRIEGRLDGLLGWFECRLCDGITLANSPYSPPTHWSQICFPVIDQPRMHAGDTIFLHLDLHIVAGQPEWKYRIQLASTNAKEC